MPKNKFLDLIEKQREEKRTEKFDGVFLDYLEEVKKNPEIVKFAHKRLYDVLMIDGYETMLDSDPRKNKIFNGDNIKIYNYFKNEFFGMERVISNVMRFLKLCSPKGRGKQTGLAVNGSSRCR